MAALWSLGIEGETEIEKAVNYAAYRNDTGPLVQLLLRDDVEITPEDRIHLAQFLRGDYRNSPGRRPATRKTTLEIVAGQTLIQRTADAVRQSMLHRKERGRSPRGWRAHAIAIYARRYGLTPQSLLNAYVRGKRRGEL